MHRVVRQSKFCCATTINVGDASKRFHRHPAATADSVLWGMVDVSIFSIESVECGIVDHCTPSSSLSYSSMGAILKLIFGAEGSKAAVPDCFFGCDDDNGG